MKKLAMLLLAVTALLQPLFATGKDGYAARALLKKTIYVAEGSGTIHKADFWSIPMGLFSFNVSREYPGEGSIAIDGEANLALISSGFIEGAGFGDRGKITVKPTFMIKKGAAFEAIEIDSIDYVFGGRTVRLKGDATDYELHLKIEKPTNMVQPKGMKAMIYEPQKPHMELRETKNMRIIGFSFTKEGAQKAYDAALKAYNEE